ncbi:short-chain dehydrogenase/reductase family 16C member 6-like, partial [Aphis craccivora]
MASNNLPADPLKFVLQLTVFFLLLVPGILWAFLKKFIPVKPKSVKGQVVLITGAARGIGRELATRFGKLGAKVACVDIDESGNHETAQIIKDWGGVANSYKCDVSKKDDIKILHSKVKQDLGPVDIVINNAGIVWGHLYIDPSKDQFITDQINVNLMAHIWMNREILPSMLERNCGHIVAMSSMSSMAGVANISTYTTTNILPYFIKTNEKVSSFLDIRFPEIPTHIAGEEMMKGILEERRIFSVPGHVLNTVQFVRLLPDNLQTLFNDILYITGTARGNGRELAMQFHRLGAKIVCVDKDEVGNNETVDRIKAEGGHAVGFKVNITDKEQVMMMHAAVRDQMGPVDILVNNSAVVETTLFANPEADETISEIVIREILPSMLERNSGHIVTMSSVTSLKGMPLLFAYSATKFALNDVITTTVCPYFIANCPDKSKARILRLPELPVEDACALIIEGILRNERVFTIPDYYYYTVPLVKFLPEDLQDMVCDIVILHRWGLRLDLWRGQDGVKYRLFNVNG